MSAATSGHPGDHRLSSLLDDPSRSVLLTDIDGTLAPIVERADQASVPHEARSALSVLSERLALVGCISGRRALEARELVGLDQLAYAGNHGLELLSPGDAEPTMDASLRGREGGALSFVEGLDRAVLEGAGLRIEDKGPIQALHWRGAADERAAEARAREVAAVAGRTGLEPRWGRKVLELRPLGGGDKGRAVATLLTTEITVAAYAGDDRTDLDAFTRLRELVSEGKLERAICVGVTSAEAPPELQDESDFTVDGPAGWVDLLGELAG